MNQRRIVFWAAGIVALLVLAAFVGSQVVGLIAAREIDQPRYGDHRHGRACR